MIPNHNPYRASIVESLQELLEIENKVLVKTLGVYMTGEWKEMQESIEPGKTIQVSLGQLETSTDQNVLTLLKLLKIVQKSIEKLKSENDITDVELGL